MFQLTARLSRRNQEGNLASVGELNCLLGGDWRGYLYLNSKNFSFTQVVKRSGADWIRALGNHGALYFQTSG